MKKSDFKKMVHEAVDEVMKEVLTVPVDKDPSLMSPDEKKKSNVTSENPNRLNRSNRTN
jgi:hypothetical protein